MCVLPSFPSLLPWVGLVVCCCPFPFCVLFCISFFLCRAKELVDCLSYQSIFSVSFFSFFSNFHFLLSYCLISRLSLYICLCTCLCIYSFMYLYFFSTVQTSKNNHTIFLYPKQQERNIYIVRIGSSSAFSILFMFYCVVPPTIQRTRTSTYRLPIYEASTVLYSHHATTHLSFDHQLTCTYKVTHYPFISFTLTPKSIHFNFASHAFTATHVEN